MSKKAFPLLVFVPLLVLQGLVTVLERPAVAHVQDPQDEILKSIGVDERLGAAVPLDIALRDQSGRSVRLGDCFAGGPVILTLNYYTCPMLCPMTLSNLLSTARAIGGISLERDFRIVTVSIDPDETQEAAAATAREMYRAMTGIPDPASRWAFLSGGAAEIGRLTSAIGFRYRKVGKEFAHPDVSVVLTPDGKISRYVYGIAQPPAFLKMALIEAAGGRIGESEAMNRVLLYCFHYDPVGKKYAIYAQNIMKAGGALTLAMLGALYLGIWRRGRSRTKTKGGS